ncbi:MAG: type II toxin-antitoxin system HicB family antitoxin [Caldilineaceae bacterium]|nr:type II toxin-antitoxin system HicB family antitoxin [Caldilineaceae bacterium]
MNLRVEVEREDDKRWIAEIPALPGVLVYGQTRQEAIAQVKALALRLLADRLEHGENVPEADEIGLRMLARVAKHTGLSPDDL